MSCFGKSTHLSKFAFCHPSLEIVATHNVVKILNSIDSMLAFLWADQDLDVIPLACGFGRIERFAGLRIDG